MLENIELCQYDSPTVVQMYAVPAVTMNMDLVAISQTGGYSTGSFLLPVTDFNRVRQNRRFPHPNSVQADG